VLETGKSFSQDAPGGISGHSSVAAVFRAGGAAKNNFPFNMSKETVKAPRERLATGNLGVPN
jgi:hypothetical protein